jgi:hypothetical protein
VRSSRFSRIAHDAGLILVGGLLVAGGATATGLITGDDVKDGSLSGRDVKDRSLTARDFKGSLRGAPGETGAKGDAGAPGAPGQPGEPGGAALETELVQKNAPASTTTPKELQVDCPNGPVLSGGYVVYPMAQPAEQGKLRAIRSYATDQDSWLVRAVDDTGALSWELTVVAVCAK